MIQILAGGKGEGKSKKILDMANEAGKTANGHVVFIDDDNRHMYDLHYDIRFVETSGFVMKDLKVLFGFICGILSQDNDIEKIFIDGLHNIVKEVTNEGLTEFICELEKTSAKSNVDFSIIISEKAEALPDKVKEYII